MTKYNCKPFITLTVTVPAEYCRQLEQAAEQLGITRHKLSRMSIETGLPMVTARLGCQQVTANNEG